METLETTEIKASKIKASKTRLSEYKEKCQRLHALIHEYARRDLAVAFSGGADSALLLKLAVLHGMQQKSQVYAMTASTELKEWRRKRVQSMWFLRSASLRKPGSLITPRIGATGVSITFFKPS